MYDLFPRSTTWINYNNLFWKVKVIGTKKALRDDLINSFHFIDETTEAKGVQVSYSGSHYQIVTEPMFEHSFQ